MNVNDKVSMEYEARVMISASEYEKIKVDYLNSGRICREFTNKNTYFDTPDLYLAHHHMVLRIREIDDVDKELTLKIKEEKGDVEITHKIDNELEFNSLLKAKFKDPQILQEISSRGGDINALTLITTLITERIEVEFDDYLLVIDKNFYNDKVDYNIEVESTSRELAEHYLKEIISPYGIAYKKDYISKSRRAIFKL